MDFHLNFVNKIQEIVSTACVQRKGESGSTYVTPSAIYLGQFDRRNEITGEALLTLHKVKSQDYLNGFKDYT